MACAEPPEAAEHEAPAPDGGCAGVWDDPAVLDALARIDDAATPLDDGALSFADAGRCYGVEVAFAVVAPHREVGVTAVVTVDGAEIARTDGPLYQALADWDEASCTGRASARLVPTAGFGADAICPWAGADAVLAVELETFEPPATAGFAVDVTIGVAEAERACD